jgi:hypothetical protein
VLKQEVLYFLAALDKSVNGLRCGGKSLEKKGTNFGDGDYFRKGAHEELSLNGVDWCECVLVLRPHWG